MVPKIKLISQVAPDQSVICIVKGDSLPAFLSLSRHEKEYAKGRLKGKEDHVFINSYNRCTYIVKIKEDLPEFRCLEELRKTASGLKKLIKSNNHSELVITSDNLPFRYTEAFAEGLILSFYTFHKYKKADEEVSKKKYPGTLLLNAKVKDAELNWLRELCQAVYLTRDLINEPPNHLNAVTLASEIKKMGSAAGFAVEVFNKKKIEALKMGGLLAVNRGSVDPPVFCILEWKPANRVNAKPLVLVGKGVIYDTGGLNIKTGDYMAQMKTDMAGAATVAGVMYAISKAQVPVHVIALIPATDNRPGGNAYVQGDVITMHNGMTVEVCNTDAEGRIILADALSYASNYSPELIINIATLTGSAALAFSNLAIATMGNAERKYFEMLRTAGEEVYERIAELPFWDEYGELIKSDIADVKNVGGREAGAITAGKFLEKFTDYPLIHLDIAGAGILKKDDHYRIKEGPGAGLRLIATFIKAYAASNQKRKK